MPPGQGVNRQHLPERHQRRAAKALYHAPHDFGIERGSHAAAQLADGDQLTRMTLFRNAITVQLVAPRTYGFRG